MTIDERTKHERHRLLFELRRLWQEIDLDIFRTSLSMDLDRIISRLEDIEAGDKGRGNG